MAFPMRCGDLPLRSVRRTSRRRGFTLIEMLIVMSIVALLLTLALPRYFGSLDKSKQVVLQENLRVLRVSIDKFSADKGRLPSSLDELVTHRYLAAVPTDPYTESAKTWVLVPSRDVDLPGIADVQSGHAQVQPDAGV
jgi:general secretion pathway protein G